MVPTFKKLSSETLSRFGKIPTQTLVDALWVMGWPNIALASSIKPVIPIKKSAVGQAVTLRFVPQRPDIAADKPKASESPEYVAFEMCGPDNILVACAIGPFDSIGGDIKFLRLAQRSCAGVITNGSVRDTSILETYKVPIFASGSTARQGPAFMQPWEVNTVVDMGEGVAVRPGDIIVADADGVVAVPLDVHEKVLEIASEREAVEEIIREELEANPGSPGKYYPFRPPIDPSSPLGELLREKLPESALLA